MGFLLRGALSVLPVRNFALGFLEAEAAAEVLRMSPKGQDKVLLVLHGAEGLCIQTHLTRRELGTSSKPLSS